jgi:hypothetical protein
LFKLYVLAEKLCLNEFANKTMDELRIMYYNFDDTFTPPTLVDYVYSHTFDDSPLREFCVQAATFEFFVCPSNSKSIYKESSDGVKKIWKAFATHGDFFESYILYLRQNHRHGLPNPGEGMGICKLHRHAKDKACYIYDLGNTSWKELEPSEVNKLFE